jgi:hypothetical protein
LTSGSRGYLRDDAAAWQPPRATHRGRSMRLESGAWWLCFVGVLAGLLGYGLTSPALLSLAGALLAAGFVTFDGVRAREGQVSPITLFAAGSVAVCVANAIGFLAQNTERRPVYFVYAVDGHLMLAAELTLAGVVLPVLGFWIVGRQPSRWPLLDLLPRVYAAIPHRALVRWGGAAAVLAIALQVVGGLPSLGTLTAIVFLLPHMTVFALARVGVQYRVPNALRVALAVALLEAGRALWFSYLRVEIVFPLLAFAFGAILGARSLRPLRSPLFLPLYAAGVVFIAYFGALGATRGRTGGLDRLMTMYELEQQGEFAPQRARQQQTVVSRLSTFNQLSQIGALVERDGFRDGATLDYLGYAFIPRFLWPEKPVIAKGGWFALQIGQAYVRRDGQPSNSVGMTIPGELYLNYGWLGVVPGCLLYGALLAVFWTRTNFWSDSRNTFGSMFGFYLLWIGFGLGADLQIIVTVTAIYLLFVGASMSQGMITALRERPARARV